jgi:hypothetical protein
MPPPDLSRFGWERNFEIMINGDDQRSIRAERCARATSLVGEIRWHRE